MRGSVGLALGALALVIAGCTTISPGQPAGAETRSEGASGAVPGGAGALSGVVPASMRPAETYGSPDGQRVAEAARSLVGARRLVIDGARYTLDCTGVVLAAYHLAGYSLDRPFARENGNGVARLWALAARHELAFGGLDQHRAPAPGDILVLDDTYDRNGNGRWDDAFTHAAVVVEVRENGDVHYVHHHYRNGIVEERFNLRHPDDPQRNAAMRMRGQGGVEAGRWLTGHLVRGTASPYLIADL